ncbi:hypothetical protein ACFLZO_01600, partial [Patescibacteria group bacterium]
PADFLVAKELAESHSKRELVDLATAHVRREALYSGLYIPLSCIFSFAVACSLYVPGLWPSSLYGGFMAIGSMFVPILVVLRGLYLQQEGRIIALAYYILENKRNENVSANEPST